MATDSTHLPQGETTVDAGTDTTGSDLDATTVQLAQVEGAQPVELPKGNQVILIPVKPGQVVELPTDSTDGLLAKIGPAPEGNLAIVIDGRTIILQGYGEANADPAHPVKIVTNDGDPVDVTEIVAATDPSLDIQTAAGPAAGGQGNSDSNGSGIFVPFGPAADLTGLHAVGILGATALQYKLIDDDHKEFFKGEDTSPDFKITFDVLGGVVNEDDLGPDEIQLPQLNERSASKFGFGWNNGANGEGNDPFDSDDRDQGGAINGGDGYPDPDREPLQTEAIINVDFHGDVPGKLQIDTTLLPVGLKSEGEDITYQLIPGGGGVGDTIIGFVNHGGVPGEFDDGDRLVFKVEVNKDQSDGEFKVLFSLYDNLDNTPPDANHDGKPDLLGADEQIQGLPVHFTITDSDGSVVFGTLPLGVEDDIPFFGKVDDCGIDLTITHTEVDLTHDETRGVQYDADDVNPKWISAQLSGEISGANFKFPSDVGECEICGAAKSKVYVSFGADGPSLEYDTKKADDPSARNSIFGELEDRTNADKDGINDGENEHPFELFMVKDGTPSDNVTEGDLTISDQKTNAKVTWGDGQVLDVYLHQVDAHTIIGYVNAPDGNSGTVQVAVMALSIDDTGCLSFLQIHQINHDVDGPTPADHDDPFTITGLDSQLIYVRATDFDGDHAITPVNLAVEDDGPCFIKTCYDRSNGQVDEDHLPNGNYGGPGDDQGGLHAGGDVLFNFGVDKPGHLAIQAMTITDDGGNTIVSLSVDKDGNLVGANDLHTADGFGVVIEASDPDSDGVVTWTAFVDTDGKGTKGDTVFTFSLDTEGSNLGHFDFCLQQALQHPDTNNDPSDDATDDGKSSYEDNLHVDVTVRGFDSDGDWADGHVNICVDDDSPDACKVEISFDGEYGNNKLVIDETKGVQDNGNSFGDPDASGQDEDDVTGPLPAFNGLGLSALGFAATQINVDLSGGNPSAPDAAYGADGPGTTSPVSIVAPGGGDFDGQKTNLHDTETGQSIFLYTENGLVVGRVGGQSGDIAFALHVDTSVDPAQLEMAQYRAIEHDNTGTRDESVTLLDCNGHSPIIFLEVTVTDADGDAVKVCQPVDGCRGNPGIVFQDDGPTICVTHEKISLAVDESVGGWGKDLDTPEPNGIKDGPAIENDEELVTLPTALTGLGTAIGAATADGSVLFHYDAGTDQEASHTYSLKLDLLDTGLTDTAKGQPISLSDAGLIDGQQVIEGKNTDGDLIFAISIDPANGHVSIAQYLAIDHGAEEDAPGAHDELVRLPDGAVSVILSVTDKDGDTQEAYSDISCSVTFDDDAPCVTLGSGTLTLAMDETVDLNIKAGDKDFPEPNDGIQDGSAEEPDALVHAAALISSGLAGLGIPIGGAEGNVAGLFSVDYGSDKAGSTTYALQITAVDGLTNLHDTQTGEQIKLIDEGGFIKGVTVTSGELVFALHIDPATGDVVSANYRAIDHGNEEPGLGAHDEVAYLGDGLLAVVATATDKDGDSDSKTVDISHSVSFDDDGPCFVGVIGIHNVDEDALSGGNPGGPGDDGLLVGKTAVGIVQFAIGTDLPGDISIQDVKVSDQFGNPVDLSDLKTADGQAIFIDKSDPESWVGHAGSLAGPAVFVFELDTTLEAVGTAGYKFTLLQPLDHPYQDDPGTSPAVETSYEDDLNFSFTVRATDHDGDSADGVVCITVDDDSPKVSAKESALPLSMDETVGGKGDVDANGSGSNDGPREENDETLVSLPGVLTGLGTVIGAAQVANAASGFNISAGADGEASRTFGISLLSSASGLIDTQTGQPVTLFDLGGGLIEGKNNDGAIVFAVYLDPATNQLSTAQYRAINHGSDQPSSFPDEVLQLGTGKIQLDATVVDKDGDSVTSHKDLGSSIRFEDDGPTANADVDSVTEDGPLTATGNVITGSDAAPIGGVPDANTDDGNPDSIGSDKPGSISWADASEKGGVDTDSSIAGLHGTLTVDANGNYKYDLNNSDPTVQALNKGDHLTETFSYTITDGDGDSKSTTLTITINGAGDPPHIDFFPNDPEVKNGKAVVSDEGLGGGNKDSSPAGDDTDSAVATGTFLVSDPDVPETLTVKLDTAGLPALKFGGVTVTWSLDPDGHTIHGQTGGTDAITIKITDTGDHHNYTYEVDLLKPLDHPTPGVEDEVNFNVNVTVTDSTNLSDTALLAIQIEDDSPVVHFSECGGILLQVDETVDGKGGGDVDANGSGAQDGQAAEGDEVLNAAAVVTAGLDLLSAEPVIGAAKSFAAALFNGNAGGDGEKSHSYDLQILNGGLTALHDTKTGGQIELVEDVSGNILGQVVGSHELVFALHIDESTGDITMAQYRAIDHGTDQPDSYPDEVTALGSNLLQVTYTITDKDDDSASASVDLGHSIRFDDDGPKASLSITIGEGGELGDNLLVHDETAGVQNGGVFIPGDNDPEASFQDEDDVKDRPSVFDKFETVDHVGLSVLGYASTKVTILDGGSPISDASYGSDGPGETDVALTQADGKAFDGQQTNLRDTQTSDFIFLFTEGDLVVGRIGADKASAATGEISFALSIDGDSIDVAQYRAILHPVQGDSDDSIALLSGEVATHPVGLVFATVTITDKDGDSVTTSLPLDGQQGHPAIVFQDDGPTAVADVDSVTEDGPLTATGNVITGSDAAPIGGVPDANTDDGKADSLGVDKFGTISWADASEKGGVDTDNSIAGLHGTLTVDDKGNYKYDLNNSDPTVQALTAGQHLTETFTYTIKDGDGDDSTTTLTITINGAGDPPKIDFFPDDPQVKNGKAVVSDEGLAGSNADSSPAGDDTNNAVATGTFVVSDPDVPETLTVKLDTVGLPSLKFGGETVTWSLDPDGHTIHGQTGGTDAITIHIETNGDQYHYKYEVDLLKPLDHPVAGSEDEVNFNVNVTVTDSTNLSDTALLAIQIEDDSPKVDLSGFCGAFLLSVDETVGGGADVAGGGPAAENDEVVNAAAVISAGLDKLGTAIGAATSSASLLFSSNPGADHEKSHSYDLQVIGGGVTTLKDTATGETIVLSEVGGVIRGETQTTHALVFAITINETTGDMTMAQYRAIDHGTDQPTSLPDEIALLGTGVLQVQYTLTDKDDDSASQTADLGNFITFDDDGPSAVADVDSVTEGGPLTATGNVVTGSDAAPIGGVADANTDDGKADSLGSDKFGSIKWTDSKEGGGVDTNGSIAGLHGTLTVDANGNYKYDLNNSDPDVVALNKGDHLTETFSYTVLDKDGDAATSTLTITINGAGDPPHIDFFPDNPNVTNGFAVVSDEGLGGGNKDSSPAGDDTDSAVATGTFLVSDPDVPETLTVTLVNSGLPALKFGGVTVTWSLDPDGHTLHGQTGGTDAITIKITDTGDHRHYTYEVDLLKPLDHPTPGSEDEVNFNVPVKVTDSTNLSDTAQLAIQIEDDSPKVTLTTSGTITLAVDETVGGAAGFDAPGGGTTHENDESEFSMPAALSSIGTTIGEAQASASGLFSPSAGADGEASHSYGLLITGGGVTGLTDTATGSAITLVQNGSVIEGRVGATTTVAFAFTIDASTGLVSMAQYRAIVHTDTTSNDDVRAMNGGVLSVTYSITDKDGDSASAQKDISSSIKFDDDGPVSATISFVGGKDTLDDEGSPLAGFTGIDGASVPADDISGKPSTVSFDVTSVNAGSDGLGSISYNLTEINAQNTLRAVDKTADGAPIVFSIDGGTGDIIGKIVDGTSPLNGTTVLRVHATDSDSFTVTELSPLFHSNQGEVNDLNFKVVLNVTDKDGDSIQTPATVKIDDDMPNATPQSGEAEAQPKMNTNLLLVLDDSGSMSESTTLTNTNKIQALKASVNELLEQYGNLGTVKVCFVRFDSGASTLTSGGNVWLTLEQAKTLLAGLTADGNTNYDAALLQAMASYVTNTGSDHKLTGADVTGPIQNVGYFISDGQPNDNNDWSSDPYHVAGWVAPATGAGVGASDNAVGINTEEEYLQYFLNQEDIKMYSIGIGNGINATAATELKHVSYDGTGAGNDDDANLYIELKDLSQLTQTLVGTVVVPINGNIGNFGADGGFVSNITLTGGLSLTFNYFTNSVSGADGAGNSHAYNAGTGDLTINLSGGSVLVINVKTGAWNYTPAGADTSTHDFGFTLTDFDGDTSSSTLSVSSSATGFKPIGRDDDVISNVDGNGATIVVPTAAFLWNDEDRDGDALSFNSTLTNRNDLDAATAVIASNVSIKDNNDQDGGSFTYEVDSKDGSDTANVTVDRSQHGNSTLNGDGLDNILVGRDGSNDTINAYQGNDVLIGGTGDDTLNGGDGRDWLQGGDGNDTLQGGAGNDMIEGGAGTNDILDFSNLSGNWSFTLGAGGSGTASIDGNDVYTGIEGVNGGSGNNTITGNTGSNVLSGNDGNDTLDGGNDVVADILNGGNGNDTLIWRDANDTYNGNADTDTLNVSNVASVNFTTVADAVVNSVEVISATGGSGTAITLNAADVISDFETGATINPTGSGPGGSYGTQPLLTINGDATDSVNLTGGGWFSATGAGGVPAGYTLYVHESSGSSPGANEDAYVLIQNGVGVATS